jgi:hypothetical protein
LKPEAAVFRRSQAVANRGQRRRERLGRLPLNRPSEGEIGEHPAGKLLDHFLRHLDAPVRGTARERALDAPCLELSLL